MFRCFVLVLLFAGGTSIPVPQLVAGNQPLSSNGNSNGNGNGNSQVVPQRSSVRLRRSAAAESLEGLVLPKCMDAGDGEPKRGKPIARVAIALYGLFRHECGSINFDAIFSEPLRHSSSYTYAIDVMAHANIVGHEDGLRNFIPGREVNSTVQVPPLMFLAFKPCAFDVTDQNVVDGHIQPILERTCYKHGDFWDNDVQCRTTKNYYRALYSQNDVANLIQQHQISAGVKYDVVVVVRPDVMFTKPMRVKLFDNLVTSGRNGEENMILPGWAAAGGYNDRFMVGNAGAVLNAMQRIKGVVDFVEHPENVKKLGIHFGKKIHSESYMKWTVMKYYKALRRDGKVGKLEKLKPKSDFNFRRVRSDGALVPSQYQHKAASGIHSWQQCDIQKLAKMFPPNAGELNNP